MIPRTRRREGVRRPSALAAAATLTAAVATAFGAATVSHAATAATLYVSPTGSGTACSAGAPCSITQAQSSVRTMNTNMTGDIVVQLAGGTYRLSAPLVFTAADSGTNGYTVSWQAAPGATPVLSGGQQVSGWTLHDSADNIWAAAVPAGADSRQLYVDGALAPRAAITISRNDVQITASGMNIVNSALNYLATLPQQNRIELESQNSFTDRYAPVSSINGTTITMQQPAWNNNNWGYDTLARPFAGGQLSLENSYSFLKNAGQWFLDPQAGQLYYKAASGQSPSGHDIELPHLTSLVQMSGSYSTPVSHIAFQGIAFEHTTWLGPSSSIGYADQQTGTFLAKQYTQPGDFLSSCQSGCQLFEATRNSWNQVPAAVQVSAASHITFSGDTFTHLGQVGLGIGNDADANASGVGLGAADITADHDTFTDDSGAGIVVGGVQPDAHHPSNAAMTVQNVTLTNNLVTGVAEDYKDMSGILSTYATHTDIEHNEVSNLAYDGIDVGWGWGMNDPGGSQDYVNRGTYNYQPIYSTPTTLKNSVVSYNKVHGTKKVFHDGGSIYTLSADPGATINNNYIYDNQHTVGLYLDEGSRYETLSNNVVQDTGVWAFTNANSNNNTNDSTFSDNWYNSGATNVATGSPHNNVLTGNVQVSGAWPTAAQQVIDGSGVSGSTGGSNTGELHAVGAAKCLDVPNSSTTGGTQLQIYTCSGGTNQVFTRTASGQLTVYSGSTQMCLDANAKGTTNGTKVIIWSCNGQTNQQWNLNADGTITGVQSGLCLDVSGASTANGALVQLWTCNGQTNQQWKLG
ncbi:ricin-type beta-trefoil lectin domain protein [Catenulispora subtropica]|uniref:RICIN domain-containing protein n=1 Tax=Catenulispora subtropica TaxID=450798 RepID=A0ABN2RFS9_9ACTN